MGKNEDQEKYDRGVLEKHQKLTLANQNGWIFQSRAFGCHGERLSSANGTQFAAMRLRNAKRWQQFIEAMMVKLLVTYILLPLLVASCLSSKQSVSQGQTSIGEIMFTGKRDGNFDVYLMNADGTGVKNLTNNVKTDYGLGWSPDGAYILFYSDRSGNEEIWRMERDGTNLINLTNEPSDERAAAYSPNGKTIVFISNRDGQTEDLYLMDADGKNVRRITHNNLYCESPRWTKDGKKIIYTLLVQKDDSAKEHDGELFVMDADGKNHHRLTNRLGFDSGADISPDGKKIAFYGKSEKGDTDIFLMDIDGGNIVNLTNDEAEDYSPSWSSDGSWISFTSGNSKNYDIYKMNIRTNEKIRLTTQSNRDETPYYNPKK